MGKAWYYILALIPSSSAVELSAVNRSVTGSNPVLGAIKNEAASLKKEAAFLLPKNEKLIDYYFERKHKKSDCDLIDPDLILHNDYRKLMEVYYWMEEWLAWGRAGSLTGKPYSDRTIELYKYYFGLYVETLDQDNPSISLENFRKVLQIIHPRKYSTRKNIYDAIMSAAKYLVEKGLMDNEERESIKKLAPKRLFPAKRPHINEKQVAEVFETIDGLAVDKYSKILSKTITVLILNTGLRLQEIVDLKISHVDLENSCLSVYLGKGNKNRRVGLNKETKSQLVKYLHQRPYSESDNFFVNKDGEPVTRNLISKKYRWLSKKLGYTVSPHALRRAFVTLNANEGKPMVHLQIACGHADLKTTRSYCRTSEDEVVEAMQDW